MFMSEAMLGREVQRQDADARRHLPILGFAASLEKLADFLYGIRTLLYQEPESSDCTELSNGVQWKGHSSDGS